eukprot:gnl/TRDRNA2_/TRDRNA2_190983_c0_seq1.p1 gnl/TRDRNA2_/TRDRNA2_190983_c0~~gnl/TRDRNA2_/TRDRNA2_190983_c0_seq1.p1  ORF type:complete len:382 (-),score=97.63 gnl/TRDRNA2_/TRDRNA2_190983_c0_seq1:52-1197(-)
MEAGYPAADGKAAQAPSAGSAVSLGPSGSADDDVDMAAADGPATVPGKPSKDPLKSIPKSPIVVLVIGMAGSGKSTWMNRLVVRLQSEQKRVYTINLDPAVRSVAYPVNIDIRDTVNYKEVMKHFGLGPNGGIMTSLNLFATKFDQVLAILDKRAPELDYVLVDTPGQIEVFNWSASGQIICDAFAVSYPTIVNYIVDTARCSKPVTFMSNMLYACSILYKTKLPFIVAFNKVDVMPHGFLQEWMQDFEKVGEALSKETSYVASLSRSMSLAMEEFYSNLRSVGVSAVSGQGCADFEKAVHDAAEEFHSSYVPFLLEQRRDMEEKRQRLIEEQIHDFEKGLDRAKRGREPASSGTMDAIEGLEEEMRNWSIKERGSKMELS